MLDSTSTSPSAADILAACSTRPQASAMAVAATAMMDSGRRLRPPHDHPQKCPRCESTHTKFCYYNNYSLSQPRYFCKTCRRYWTKGGTLRNIPVGGGCRKNKKPSSSNSSSSTSSGKKPSNVVTTNTSDLMALAHSHQNYQNDSLGFSHFGANGMMGSSTALGHSNVGLLESKYGGLLSPIPRPIDFLDSKFDLMGVNNDNLVMVDPGSNGDHHQHHMGLNHGLGLNNNNNNNNNDGFHGFCPASNGNGGGDLMDISTSQRLMLSNYDHHHYNHHEDNQRVTSIMDVKPSPKLLSLDWQQSQGNSNGSGGKSDGGGYVGGGYINGLGSSWNGLMSGYGSSTKTNYLI